MAIDTELKRRSVQGYTITSFIGLVPDGTVGAPDRAMVGWMYSGLTYSATVANVFINIAQDIGRTIAQKIAFWPTESRSDT